MYQAKFYQQFKIKEVWYLIESNKYTIMTKLIEIVYLNHLNDESYA